MLRVGVLVSGGGTNLQAILDAVESKQITNARIECVISSRTDAYALERAKKYHIPTRCVLRKDYTTQEEFDTALVAVLSQYDVGLVVLAGFMTIFGRAVVKAYENRIINVHPALIPSFCGKGFYGLKVHEAVLASGVKLTGATVHLVNEIVDGGAIIAQKAVDVKEDDTPETLQRRVMEEAEWILLPRVIEYFASGRIELQDGKVKIKG